MEREFEDFIKNIESNYAESAYSSDITEDKRAKLRELRPQRDKIYSELEKIYNQDIERFRRLACFLEQGFLYIAEDNYPFHKIDKLYREVKRKLDVYLKKQNAKLIEVDSLFKNDPIRLQYHAYDNPNPPKQNRPIENKTYLIKSLSGALKTRFPQDSDRSEFISKILHSFYRIFEQSRSIRKHF